MTSSSPAYKKQSSGVFVQDGDGYSEMMELPGNGSINDINLHLGYRPSQVFGYFDTKRKDTGIILVSVEIFTKNIVFVLTEKSVVTLGAADMADYFTSFTFETVFPSYVAEPILKQGIEDKSLTFEYLSRVLMIKDGDPDGLVYVERLELYLYFIDGILVDFQASDGLNEWAKLWKQKNRQFLLDYYRVAQLHWPGRTDQILAEINAQADAWAGIPNAIDNEYIPLHTTSHGTVNFVMLRVCHYTHTMSFDEFATINHGRFVPVGHDIYQVGRFAYTFDREGDLVSSGQKW